MNFTDAPPYTATPFAVSGSKNTIPVPSQPAGAASYTDGFPAVTMQPISSGGIPPAGQDVNGILFQLSTGQRFIQAGGVYGYDATFSSGISGYPKGAMLKRSDGFGYWMSLVDANTTNPDSGGANWAAVRANVGTTTIPISVGTNTPTLEKLAAETLLLTGSIASAATLILPLTAGGSWIVVNNTSGAGALNIKGATGTGVTIDQATALHVFTDGTNFYAIAAPTTGAYLPLHGTADAAVKLATARAIDIIGLVTATAVNFDGTANVNINVTAVNVPGALGYTPANDAAVVHLAGTETISGAKTFGAAMNGTSATFSGAMKAASYQSTSTREVKHDLVALDDPFDRLAPVRGYTGRYIERLDPAQKRRCFVLLEELRDTLPEVVFDDATVDYTGLVPVLIEAVKQLNARVQELERRGQ